MAMSPRRGFTLVEVIITLLVAVILGAIMMQYSGSALSKAAHPIKRLKINTALQAVADQIIGAFRQAAPSDSAAWSNFQSGIGAAGTDQNNAYGEYRVLFNDFIQFDAAGNEIPTSMAQHRKTPSRSSSPGQRRFTDLFLVR
jgi:prepilin-type N-terminal cleavage/methylation domain-containing protein